MAVLPNVEGWYPDPNGTPLERYFNGEAWTAEIRYPSDTSFKAEAPPPSHGPGLPVPQGPLNTDGPRTRAGVTPAEEHRTLPPMTPHPRVAADRAAREAAANRGRKAAPSVNVQAGGTYDPKELDKPLYDAGFADSFTRVWKNWAKFAGRASRAEYWWGYLGLFLLSLIPCVSVFAIPPLLSSSVRRLHDVNRSGWILATPFIPVVLFFGVIILMGNSSSSDPNVLLFLMGALSLVYLLLCIYILVLLVGPSKPAGARFG